MNQQYVLHEINKSSFGIGVAAFSWGISETFVSVCMGGRWGAALTWVSIQTVAFFNNSVEGDHSVRVQMHFQLFRSMLMKVCVAGALFAPLDERTFPGAPDNAASRLAPYSATRLYPWCQEGGVGGELDFISRFTRNWIPQKNVAESRAADAVMWLCVWLRWCSTTWKWVCVGRN